MCVAHLFFKFQLRACASIRRSQFFAAHENTTQLPSRIDASTFDKQINNIQGKSQHTHSHHIQLWLIHALCEKTEWIWSLFDDLMHDNKKHPPRRAQVNSFSKFVPAGTPSGDLGGTQGTSHQIFSNLPHFKFHFYPLLTISIYFITAYAHIYKFYI